MHNTVFLQMNVNPHMNCTVLLVNGKPNMNSDAATTIVNHTTLNLECKNAEQHAAAEINIFPTKVVGTSMRTVKSAKIHENMRATVAVGNAEIHKNIVRVTVAVVVEIESVLMVHSTHIRLTAAAGIPDRDLHLTAVHSSLHT